MKILPKGKYKYVLYPLTKIIDEEIGGIITKKIIEEEGVIEITPEELNGIKAKTHCFSEDLKTVILKELTPEEIRKNENREIEKNKIKRKTELKALLKSYSEDQAQIFFGAVFPDYEERKKKFQLALNELRNLEGKSSREFNE